jgi:transposase
MGKSIRNLSPVTRVGLDLAKRVFQVHAVDARGEIVVARKLTRSRLIPFFAELPPCVVAMEAGASAHHWGGADRTRARGSIAAARACEAPRPPQQKRPG